MIKIRKPVLGAVAVLVVLTAACAGGQPSGPEALLPNGVLLPDGTLLGGQPSAEQLQAIRDAGFRTVINMRLPEEGGTTRGAAEALGMTYAALPTPGSDGMTEANARELGRLLQESEGPVVVHCASGNRTGGLFALKAHFVDGVSPEEALAAGRAAGMTRTEPKVRQILGLPPR